MVVFRFVLYVFLVWLLSLCCLFGFGVAGLRLRVCWLFIVV